MTLLALEGVSKSFATRRHRRLAVDHVSLSVARGEILGLVGESGCGKSTLARLALRLVDPDEGRILFDATDVTGLSGSALAGFRRRIQLVFQDPLGSLNPRATIRALLEDPLRVNRIGSRDERRRQGEALAARVRLPLPLLDRFPHEISGGQRQRVGIARALAVEPELLVADEPVSALDVSVRSQILNLLADLQQGMGLTVVLIAHDLAAVEQLADRVAVFYLGRIVELAPRAELFARPLHPYTVSLLAAVPVAWPLGSAPGAERRVRAPLAGEPPSPAAPPPGCPFHPRCPVARARCAVERPELLPAAPGPGAAPAAGAGRSERLVACFFPGSLPPGGIDGPATAGAGGAAAGADEAGNGGNGDVRRVILPRLEAPPAP